MQKQYICCIIVVIFSFYDNVKLKLLCTYVYELLRNKGICEEKKPMSFNR